MNPRILAFSALAILMILVVGVSCHSCQRSVSYTAPPVYVEPGQPAPVVIQQQPNNNNGFVEGVILGHMINGNSQPSTTTVEKHYHYSTAPQSSSPPAPAPSTDSSPQSSAPQVSRSPSTQPPAPAPSTVTRGGFGDSAPKAQTTTRGFGGGDKFGGGAPAKPAPAPAPSTSKSFGGSPFSSKKK